MHIDLIVRCNNRAQNVEMDKNRLDQDYSSAHAYIHSWTNSGYILASYTYATISIVDI